MLLIQTKVRELRNLEFPTMHYLLIGEMICLDHRDQFSIVSALVFMVIDWTKLTVNHDIKLSTCHDSPSYYVA